MRSYSVFVWTVFVLLLSLYVAVVLPSSHSEAPESSKYRSTDATDFYMFRSYETGRSDYVTLIANYYPLQDTYGGPNYFTLSDEHFYEIYIDNNGDSQEDYTFQFMFGNSYGNNGQGITLNVGGQDVAIPLKFLGPITGPQNSDEATLNWVEYYQLGVIPGTRDNYANIRPITNQNTGSTKFRKPFDNAGPKTIPSYDSYSSQFIYNISIPQCTKPGKVFVGQRKDPFSVHLGGIFDLIDFVPIMGPAFPGGITNSPKNDELKKKAVTAITLELPISCFAGSSGIIGGWTAVRTLSHDDNDNHIPGDQTNRLGNPLINELVIGLPDKDFFNLQQPKDDIQFANYATNPSLPVLINALFLPAVNQITGAGYTHLNPTNYPRNDLVAAALTGFPNVNQPPNVVPGDMLRLNTKIAVTPKFLQKSLGIIGGDNAGYPNGRRPGDDIVDIILRVMMGRLCYPPFNAFGYCQPQDAPVGLQPITDGAPQNSRQFSDKFPYLLPPRAAYNTK
jgi:hypothetical protein